jgi:hypothetical protein
LAVLVAASLTWSTSLAAQSPEAVARAVLRADSLGDWAMVLRFAHPEALRDFRTEQVFQVRVMGGDEWPGSEMMTQGLDSLQRARLAQERKQQVRTLLDSVYRVNSIEALARLPAESVFARITRSRSSNAHPQSGGTDSSFIIRYRIIGSVSAGDTLAYVVIQRLIPRPPDTLPEEFKDLPHHPIVPVVMTMRRYRGQWRSMLDVGFEGGTTMVFSQIDSLDSARPR